jgi:hypothetical protein
MEQIMSSVRTEIRQESIAMQEAQKAQAQEHAAMATDLKPEVALDDLPKNASVGTAPAKEQSADANNSDPFKLDAAA